MNKRLLISIMAGNTLEWYDFIAYGTLAPIIAKLFFPEHSQFMGLFLTFTIFAIGYFTRPIGGLIFGHIADRHGRKLALILSITFMSIPTFLMGLLPTYAHIGGLAAILLLILRLMQGLSVGGEYPTTMAYLIESAASRERGYMGSYAVFGVVLGIIISTTVLTLLTANLGPVHMYSWGWRIPFLLSLILVVITLLMRIKLPDSIAYQKIEQRKQVDTLPLLSAFRANKLAIFNLFVFLIFNSIAFYSITIFIASYLTIEVKIPLSQASAITLIGSVWLLLVIIVAGKLSDRIGRKTVSLCALIGTILFSVPLYILYDTGIIAYILVAQLVSVTLLGFYLGPMPAFISEMFSTPSRCSSLSIAYNINLALFGGTTPVVCFVLIKYFHTLLAPAYYLILAGILSFIVIMNLKETYRMKLK